MDTFLCQCSTAVSQLVQQNTVILYYHVVYFTCMQYPRMDKLNQSQRSQSKACCCHGIWFLPIWLSLSMSTPSKYMHRLSIDSTSMAGLYPENILHSSIRGKQVLCKLFLQVKASHSINIVEEKKRTCDNIKTIIHQNKYSAILKWDQNCQNRTLYADLDTFHYPFVLKSKCSI